MKPIICMLHNSLRPYSAAGQGLEKFIPKKPDQSLFPLATLTPWNAVYNMSIDSLFLQGKSLPEEPVQGKQEGSLVATQGLQVDMQHSALSMYTGS